jgi:DNA-binding NarL/FixJ family response regulator
VKILLVDDHALFREGLKHLLRSLDAELELDEAEDCEGALALSAGNAYDLVLLDLKIPGVHGLDALESLRRVSPAAPVVVVSGEDDPRVIRAAIERGAMGYVPKASTPEIMIQALRLVLAKGVYLPPGVVDLAIPNGAPLPELLRAEQGTLRLPGLTPRQMDVLRCVIQGKANKVIARELDISEATVKAHLSSVLRVLGVNNRTEAVYAAAKLGLQLV